MFAFASGRKETRSMSGFSPFSSSSSSSSSSSFSVFSNPPPSSPFMPPSTSSSSSLGFSTFANPSTSSPFAPPSTSSSSNSSPFGFSFPPVPLLPNPRPWSAPIPNPSSSSSTSSAPLFASNPSLTTTPSFFGVSTPSSPSFGFGLSKSSASAPAFSFPATSAFSKASTVPAVVSSSPTSFSSGFQSFVGTGNGASTTSSAASVAKPPSTPAETTFSAVVSLDTTSSLPSLALAPSTKISSTASSGHPQSSTSAPLVGSGNVKEEAEGELGRDCLAKELVVSVAEQEALCLRTNQDVLLNKETHAEAEGELGRDGLAKEPAVSVAEQAALCLRTNEDVLKKETHAEVSTIPTSSFPVQLASNPSIASMLANFMSKVLPEEAIVVTTDASIAELNGADNARVTEPGKEVQLGLNNYPSFIKMKAEGISCVTSTVDAEDETETGAYRAGSRTFCISAPFVEVNGYFVTAQNGQVVKQLFDEYGDITEGSIMQSVAVKSGLLELVADAVHRLCNHTKKTLGLAELRLIQQHTADALTAGFKVDWLHQRVEKTIVASDYYVRLMELDKLTKQVEDAKKSLMEMERRQMICMEEVAAIKGKMEENGLGESKLGEGLL